MAGDRDVTVSSIVGDKDWCDRNPESAAKLLRVCSRTSKMQIEEGPSDRTAVKCPGPEYFGPGCRANPIGTAQAFVVGFRLGLRSVEVGWHPKRRTTDGAGGADRLRRRLSHQDVGDALLDGRDTYVAPIQEGVALSCGDPASLCENNIFLIKIVLFYQQSSPFGEEKRRHSRPLRSTKRVGQVWIYLVSH